MFGCEFPYNTRVLGGVNESMILDLMRFLDAYHFFFWGFFSSGSSLYRTVFIKPCYNNNAVSPCNIVLTAVVVSSCRRVQTAKIPLVPFFVKQPHSHHSSVSSSSVVFFSALLPPYKSAIFYLAAPSTKMVNARTKFL